jgi:hypothetical protein
MKFYGNAHLQQNLLQEAVIPLDTAFPATPRVGQLVFKDRILYICVEITGGSQVSGKPTGVISGGLPVWVPLTNEVTAHYHIQSTPAATWTIEHELNTTHVVVMCYDDSPNRRKILPNEIVVLGNSDVEVQWSSAQAGKAVVVTGHLEGNRKPNFAYEHYQTTPSTSWVIAHGLGRNPLVRIFIGNQEVQPATITFNDLDTVTVTFTTANVGSAKLI